MLARRLVLCWQMEFVIHNDGVIVEWRPRRASQTVKWLDGWSSGLGLELEGQTQQTENKADDP